MAQTQNRRPANDDRPTRAREPEGKARSARKARPPRADKPESEGKVQPPRADKPENEGRAQPPRKARPARADKPEGAGKARPPRAKEPDGKARPVRANKPTSATRAASAAQPKPRPRRKKLTRQQVAQLRVLATCKRVSVISCAVLLGLGALVGTLFFARPSVSAVENRALTAFPTMSWDDFWSGKFFSDFALWYSDTYPVREQMVGANKAIESVHGLPTETQMIGGTKQADELPPVDDANSAAKSDRKTQTHEKVEVPDQDMMAEAVQSQITDGLYVKGDAAYNVYYFAQEAVEGYADALNTLADAVDGQATVYSIVVPTSSGVMLSEDEASSLGGTNQEDALKYFYSLYNPNVIAIDTMGALKKHTDEYIYYRTDHHWTARGSYFAYKAFCDEKGIDAEDRDDMKYKDMGDYLGSYYSQLNSDAMAANPDHMEAWYPNATNDITVYDTDGTEGVYEIVQDTSKADAFGKGLTFIMGDQSLEKITNPELSDGSSVLVIKDSFADSFVPWLVDNYETVWVADFRYFEGSYVDLINENDIKDVIVLNTISLAGGGVVAPSILGKL